MAITGSLINQEALCLELGVALKHAIHKAAEPLIQEALAEIEARMRQRVAEFAIGTIKHQFDCRMFGDVVEIRIRQGNGNVTN